MLLPCGSEIKILAEVVGFGETGNMASTVVEIDSISVDVWHDDQVGAFSLIIFFFFVVSYFCGN